MLSKGDRVRVKTWKEIAALGYVHGDGHVLLPTGELFVPMMNEFCGKEYEVDEKTIMGNYYLKGITGWVFPLESLEKV